MRPTSGTGPRQHAPGPDSGFLGCEDLNQPAMIQADGMLFRKGEGQPEELFSMVVFDRASVVRRTVDPV